ncbi:Salivary gland secretion 1 [Rhodotorula toruloides ATCC 204091]|uniref:Salivary gland secretion 1 n=1 Tax=Rhodotorula toruloides TaxID=5286 RepID=A0A0K3CM42_RHOTO|nr:Salivary gland secretion 1 [Rhodotorula toruloides ATCC 204091]PRQ70749.1 salivary gland secretion 1 [Rhodotorula toruloides]
MATKISEVTAQLFPPKDLVVKPIGAMHCPPASSDLSDNQDVRPYLPRSVKLVPDLASQLEQMVDRGVVAAEANAEADEPGSSAVLSPDTFAKIQRDLAASWEDVSSYAESELEPLLKLQLRAVSHLDEPLHALVGRPAPEQIFAKPQQDTVPFGGGKIHGINVKLRLRLDLVLRRGKETKDDKTGVIVSTEIKTPQATEPNGIYEATHRTMASHNGILSRAALKKLGERKRTKAQYSLLMKQISAARIFRNDITFWSDAYQWFIAALVNNESNDDFDVLLSPPHRHVPQVVGDPSYIKLHLLALLPHLYKPDQLRSLVPTNEVLTTTETSSLAAIPEIMKRMSTRSSSKTSSSGARPAKKGLFSFSRKVIAFAYPNDVVEIGRGVGQDGLHTPIDKTAPPDSVGNGSESSKEAPEADDLLLLRDCAVDIELDSLVGEGEVGLVYRGLDNRTQDSIILKLAKPDAEDYLKHEVECGRLLHDYADSLIAPCELYATAEGRLFTLMVDGGASPSCAADLTLPARLDLLQSLARLHYGGFQHGDVGLRNIVVDDVGKARWIDLSAASLEHRCEGTECDEMVEAIALLELGDYDDEVCAVLQDSGLLG